MTRTWTKTFEVSVPIERWWKAFTEEAKQSRSASPDSASRADPNASAKVHVLDVQPMKRLRWTQDQGTMPERTEFTVVFESTDGGSRFTVTRCGFGEGEDKGWGNNYNFGTREAAIVRWKAALAAGVNLIATDQYEEFSAVLRAATRSR